jgi:PAS domain S-box-containing protein
LSEELDALRDSGGLLASVIASLDDVVFVLDRDCRYYGVWGRWLEMYSIDPAEFIGKTCAEVWAQEAGEFEAINRQVLGGETVVCDRWFEMPWGEVYYESTLSPLRGPSGEVIGICGIRQDVTDLKRAEDAIRREKEYAQHLIDSANVMVVGLDAEGSVQLFNHAAELVTGWSRAEILGCDWFETVVPRDR